MRRFTSRGFFALIAVSLALASFAQAPPKPPAQTPASPGPVVPPQAKAAAPASRTRPAPVTSLDVVVTDPAGKPVEGAFVMALPVEGAYRSFGALAPEKVRSTLTGREGKAKLESLPPGPWNLTAHARGFVTHRARRVASGPLAVRLEKGGAVTGVVAEADGGRPVAGARVSVEEWLAPPRDWEVDATRNETATDARGRFHGPDRGRRGTAAGRTRARGGRRRSRPAGLRERPHGGRGERGRPLRPRPAAAGDAESRRLRPGSRLAPGGGVLARPRPHGGPGRRLSRDGPVDPWPRVGARGRRHRRGEPPPQRPRRRPEPARGDERGGRGFVVGGLRAGLYEVRARAAGFAAATARTEAGGQPIELVMEAGGEITGTVVDTQGQPLEEARVQARPAQTQTFEADRFHSGGADDGGGRFVLRDVKAGTYDLEAQATGHGTASVTDVRVSPGRTTSAGTITLGRGGVVRGVVVDSAGDGIPGASVYADRDTNTRTSYHHAQSDSTGAFEIRGVPTGRFEVRAGHPSYAPGKPVSVEVDPEKEPVPARIVLVRGGRLEGHVRHRDGRPFSEGRVLVSGGAGFSWPEPAVVGREDGSYELVVFSPGPAGVALQSSSSAQTYPGRQVTIPDVERYELDLEISDTAVAGVVVDRETGDPVGDARVGLRNVEAGSGWGGWGSTGPDGRFTIAAEPGEYRLEANAPGRTRATLSVSVGPAGASDLRVEMDRGLAIVAVAPRRERSAAYLVRHVLDWVSGGSRRSHRMPAATLTEKGQIVIPAEIRARYQLTPGTQVEFVHEDGTIRLVVRRRVAPSDPAAGYGMIKVKPRRGRRGSRRLSDFDAAALLGPRRNKA